MTTAHGLPEYLATCIDVWNKEQCKGKLERMEVLEAIERIRFIITESHIRAGGVGHWSAE